MDDEYEYEYDPEFDGDYDQDIDMDYNDQRTDTDNASIASGFTEDIDDPSKKGMNLSPKVRLHVPDGSFILKDYSEVEPLMESLETEVASLLNLDIDVVEILLQKSRWNREQLCDAYFQDGDRVLKELGVELYDTETIRHRLQSVASIKSQKTPHIIACRICSDEFRLEECFAMQCDHWFCRDCYTSYLRFEVEKGPVCITSNCPEHKCLCALTKPVFEELLGDESEDFKRYRMYFIRNFIEVSKSMKYCPSVNCNKVAFGSGVTKIQCTCGSPFCFRCGEEAHDPCSCSQVSEWMIKCQDESETANWIIANTKKCPKCLARIEKNQGCNHMTCKLCKFEFCWICLMVWSEHNQNTGGYYKCNRFGANAETATESDKAKAELDRYLHYYQRYHNHEESLKYAAKQRENAEKKMLERQETRKSSWSNELFVKHAVELVIECRRVLKFTYVVGFFLPVDPVPEKHLFEHHQEMLEKNTDTLQELTEKAHEDIDRTQVINLTRVTEKFLESMLSTSVFDLQSSISSDSKTSNIPTNSKKRLTSTSPRLNTRSTSKASHK